MPRRRRQKRRRGLSAFALLMLAYATITAGVWYWSRGPLRVPVHGVSTSKLVSTFGAPRSGGRKHKGVDIFADKGTPVHPMGKGFVVRVGENRLGGKTVHTFGHAGALCYYAHLDHWGPDAIVGKPVTRSSILGYVGNTGNAATTKPHLHFEVRPMWRGLTATDPVPFLRKR